MSAAYEILKYISKEEVDRLPVVRVREGETFISADKQEVVKLYYILEGRVDIFSLSYGGREFFVDQLGKDDFIGKFSQVRGFDFRCSVKAGTDITLLDVTSYSEMLLGDGFTKFGRFFHRKTTDRVYVMYRFSMMRMLFTCEEIFAYWLWTDKEKDTNIVSDLHKIFYRMNISDRQVFYLLKKFKEAGLIKKGKRQAEILDMDGVSRMAEHVLAFMSDV